jgi:hypothetical protein
MKKILLLLLSMPCILKAQLAPVDSTTFTFSVAESLTHTIPGLGLTSSVAIDTSGASLWKIGSTLKSIFSNDTVASRGIMTDTSNPYPANANDFFVLKVHDFINYTIDFWHKYQTDSLHAGCIIEFSSDSGTTWINIADCPGMILQNVYSSADTLITGQPAFTGTSNGEQHSSFQFINCVGVRLTSTMCFPDYGRFSDNYIRFRFVSDSTVDSLSGWIIDSIRMVNYDCPGSVANVNNTFQPLNIFPNPATSMLTIQSPNEPINTIAITNILGQTVYSEQFAANSMEAEINVSNLSTGIYFVKINNEVRKFLKQ